MHSLLLRDKLGVCGEAAPAGTALQSKPRARASPCLSPAGTGTAWHSTAPMARHSPHGTAQPPRHQLELRGFSPSTRRLWCRGSSPDGGTRQDGGGAGCSPRRNSGRAQRRRAAWHGTRHGMGVLMSPWAPCGEVGVNVSLDGVPKSCRLLLWCAGRRGMLPAGPFPCSGDYSLGDGSHNDHAANGPAWVPTDRRADLLIRG